MITQVVAVQDRALAAFGMPFNTHTLGHAIRSFTDEINDTRPENAMNKHPDDFDLYHLGTYDNISGQFTNLETPMQIAIGKNCKL